MNDLIERINSFINKCMAVAKADDLRQAKQLSDLRDMRSASRIQTPQIQPIKPLKKPK